MSTLHLQGRSCSKVNYCTVKPRKYLMQHGPFTPQECDKIAQWLTGRGIDFQILKDEESEKAFRANDGQNVVQRAEFRTETFLAQLFYIDIPEMSPFEEKEFASQFLPPEEKPPASLKVEPEREFSLHQDALRSRRQKRLWARILAAAWIVLLIVSVYQYMK